MLYFSLRDLEYFHTYFGLTTINSITVFNAFPFRCRSVILRNHRLGFTSLDLMPLGVQIQRKAIKKQMTLFYFLSPICQLKARSISLVCWTGNTETLQLGFIDLMRSGIQLHNEKSPRLSLWFISVLLKTFAFISQFSATLCIYYFEIFFLGNCFIFHSQYLHKIANILKTYHFPSKCTSWTFFFCHFLVMYLALMLLFSL